MIWYDMICQILFQVLESCIYKPQSNTTNTIAFFMCLNDSFCFCDTWAWAMKDFVCWCEWDIWGWAFEMIWLSSMPEGCDWKQVKSSCVTVRFQAQASWSFSWSAMIRTSIWAESMALAVRFPTWLSCRTRLCRSTFSRNCVEPVSPRRQLRQQQIPRADAAQRNASKGPSTRSSWGAQLVLRVSLIPNISSLVCGV